MNEEELKRLWRQQKLDAPAKLSAGDQIQLMRIKMKALDRAYLWVDAMIIGIAAGIVLFFAWHFLKVRPLMARIGLAIMIASTAFDIWRRIRARRVSRQPAADASVAQWLRRELEKERARSEQSRWTLLWDLLPFWTGAIVFTWGLDIHVSSRIFFSAVMTAIQVILYVSSWKLNQYTWRKASLPLKQELESLLKSNAPE